MVLSKTEYGKEKRSKTRHVNKWDCRPDTRRIVDPNKARMLRERLSEVEKKKIDSADFAICTATTEKARKQALENKSMMTSYGTSCFLQILDEEPAPQPNRKEELRKQRLARANEKKQLFLQQLAVQQASIQKDHDYGLKSCDTIPAKQCPKSEIVIQKRANELYSHHVCLSPSSISEIEESTRGQHESEKWYHERRLRVTASVMKEICHQRPSTSCTTFIKKKLSSTSINVPAISYGRKNENKAISSYADYHRSKGKFVQIESYGLYVDKSTPWLAASPDGIVNDLSEESHSKGCLEVKCPYVCEKRTVTDACRNVSGFCLTEADGIIKLSESHMYFYQMQTQMHVTRLHWCDFCVWSPLGGVFVQRIKYDKVFMDTALMKAKKFYFNKFLPEITSYMIISTSDHSTLFQHSSTKETSTHGLVLQNPYLKANSGYIIRKPDPNLNLVTPQLHSASASHITENQDSRKQEFGSEILVSARNCNQSLDKSKCKKIDEESYDLHIVAAYSKPSQALQTIKCILLHLKLQKHAVRADGNCLYYAIAHQAGLIPPSSDGDKAVCRHLRHLAFLTMLNYPTIQSEGSLSPVDWTNKQQRVLQDNEWGGDVEIRLMAIGLKKEVIVITDSTIGNVFARKYPYLKPPVSKMKGGVFIPLTCDELCASLPSSDSLIILYNGCNHYDSTKPL